MRCRHFKQITRAFRARAFLVLLALTGAVGTPLAGSTLQPYTPDATTLHLWHLNESTTPCVDSAPGGTNLTALAGGATLGTTQVTAAGLQ